MPLSGRFTWLLYSLPRTTTSRKRVVFLETYVKEILMKICTVLSLSALFAMPAIAQDAGSLEVLMLAWMNAESITKTLETGRVTYWSRSRQAFWVKGESSGHTQKLVSFRYDCDRDCVLVLVRQTGPACHTKRRSCFYRAVEDGHSVELMKPME